MVCCVKGTIFPFHCSLSFQKVDVGKYTPRKNTRYSPDLKENSSILHTNLSVAKNVNVLLLTWFAAGYFLTLLPGGLPFPLMLRSNWISRLLSALTDTYSPFFPVCSLPLSFIYSYCLPLRVADATWNRKEKSRGNHNVQTDRSHYMLRMCRKTEMDNR